MKQSLKKNYIKKKTKKKAKYTGKRKTKRSTTSRKHKIVMKKKNHLKQNQYKCKKKTYNKKYIRFPKTLKKQQNGGGVSNGLYLTDHLSNNKIPLPDTYLQVGPFDLPGSPRYVSPENNVYDFSNDKKNALVLTTPEENNIDSDGDEIPELIPDDDNSLLPLGIATGAMGLASGKTITSKKKEKEKTENKSNEELLAELISDDDNVDDDREVDNMLEELENELEQRELTKDVALEAARKGNEWRKKNGHCDAFDNPKECNTQRNCVFDVEKNQCIDEHPDINNFQNEQNKNLRLEALAREESEQPLEEGGVALRDEQVPEDREPIVYDKQDKQEDNAQLEEPVVDNKHDEQEVKEPIVDDKQEDNAQLEEPIVDDKQDKQEIKEPIVDDKQEEASEEPVVDNNQEEASEEPVVDDEQEDNAELEKAIVDDKQNNNAQLEEPIVDDDVENKYKKKESFCKLENNYDRKIEINIKSYDNKDEVNESLVCFLIPDSKNSDNRIQMTVRNNWDQNNKKDEE